MKGRESETSLRKNEVVRKDHPVIVLRGALDLLEAMLIRTSALAVQQGHKQLSDDLSSILCVCGRLMHCEVLCEPMEPPAMLGMNAEMLREISHHPERHMGLNHFMPTPQMGLLMAELNLCRAQARQTEIEAVRAFGDDPARQDLLAAYNRVSSALYIVMCRLHANKYELGDN